MNRKLSMLAALLLLAACILSGCEKVQSSSVPSSMPEATPAATAAPAPTASPTPAPTATPQPTSTPEPSPAADFETLFKANPVDAQLEEDLAMAMTTRSIVQAYEQAANSWQGLLDNLFRSTQETLPEKDQETFRQEQETWQNGQDEAIADIQTKSGEGDDGLITVACETMEFYRDRAYEICKVYYSANQTLPDFEVLLQPVG